MTKVAVLIISRGSERKQFLDFARKQISKQTRQPDTVLVIDHPPINDKPDITARYKMGYDILSQQGFELIVPFEDDDYYSTSYLDIMVRAWEACGKPDIFGSNTTVYYHLFNQVYTEINHPGRASMCCTLIKAGLEITWNRPEYKFADLTLWQQFKGKTFPAKDIHLGIKHGIGLSGGVGHKTTFFMNTPYEKSLHDTNYNYLRAHTTPEAFNFYQKIING